MSLPNLFNVGANKAGTTSLYQYLSEHPEIFMCLVKEPMYFNLKDHAPLESNSPNKKNTLEEYEELFKGSENYKVRGEESTAYMANPKVAEEIKR